MKLEVLSPGMQDREEADLGPQMLGIRRDGLQSVGRGLKENAVNDLLVLVGDGSDLFWYCEHDMKIGAFEEFRLSILDPLRPGKTLALRAVAVPAAIEGIAFIAALIAVMTRRCAIDIDAPCCCR